MAFWDTVMDAPGDVPYGKRLIPATVDAIAAADPDRVCFSYPASPASLRVFQDVTFRTFANAVNKTAHFIQREIGRGSMFETVMYMGFPDVRHFIALVALMKTGHKVLFSSHRNSVAGHANLIKRTDCTILLHTTDFPVTGILEKCRMESLCMPELDYLLDDASPCEHYPYNKSFDEAKHHPCMIIHTSGSTGLPKLVVWTHWTFITVDSHHLVPPLDGRPTIWGGIFSSAKRGFSALPIFHGSGLASGLNQVCFNRSVTVLGPPGIVTAGVFEEVLENTEIDAAYCLPITLEEIAKRADLLKKLERLKFVTYVGGPLSKAAGDAISQHVRLYAIMASTETSVIVQHATDAEDWQYICLNPTYNGIDMRTRGDLHELVFVKDDQYSDFQGVFKSSSRSTEHSMSDLYSKHPSKAHHWKHEGRKDDVIVFRNGWNFNPRIHEDLITSHGAVRNCILIGTGKDMPAAIIELQKEYLVEGESTKERLLASLGPKIDEANSYADMTGQLRKDCVIIASKEKPFPISGKGSVQRKMTVALYSSEIEQLYAALGDGVSA